MTASVSPQQLFPVLQSLDFDIESGIEYCGNDKVFYCDLIRELHSDVLVRRSGELAGEDLVRRREFAHLLKGTLQVLGEQRASKKARELELALRSGASHQELADRLLADLDLMHASLQKVFSGGV